MRLNSGLLFLKFDTACAARASAAACVPAETTPITVGSGHPPNPQVNERSRIVTLLVKVCSSWIVWPVIVGPADCVLLPITTRPPLLIGLSPSACPPSVL